MSGEIVDDYLNMSELKKHTRRKKRKRGCGACENYRKDNCGNCVNCLDMEEFGGKGRRKQKCMEQKCLRRP